MPHPKTTTCHHQPSATTHAFAWHLQHKTSIQYTSTIYLLGYLGVMVEFGRTFLFFHPYKKCAKITSVPLGSLADKLYLHVVCLFCAASTRRRHELLPSQWWQVVVFGLWQTNSETAIIKATFCCCPLCCSSCWSHTLHPVFRHSWRPVFGICCPCVCTFIAHTFKVFSVNVHQGNLVFSIAAL